MVRSLLIGVVLAAGCVRGGGSYTCTTDAECVLAGASGRCEAAGFCSFPDSTCDTGFRFGVHSGSFAGDCVVAESTGSVTIGGSVAGLVGTNLVLRNNGADDLQVSQDGPFEFGTPIANGAPYAVSIATQPASPSQTCEVAMGTGVAGDVDVTSVAVSCATETFSLGGSVVGLVGSGLVVAVNGGNDLPIDANGAFTFPTPLASGQSYLVTIEAQPSGQTCTLSGASGTIGTANVTTVVVNCVSGAYTVGGMVSGLDGTVVLRNNGVDSATITANGSFAFATPLATGSSYTITVQTQPAYPPRSQSCSVSGGAGTVGAANVSSVIVTCSTSSYTIGGAVTGLSGTLVLRNGSEMLTLTQSGAFTFPSSVTSGNTYNVSISTQPSGQTCTLARAAGTVMNGNVTDVAASCGSMGGNPGILCGTFYCNPAAGEICCVSNGTPACTTSCKGAGNQPYRCDSQPDCAAAGSTSTICCGSLTNGVAINSYCGGAMQCTPGTEAYYCDPNAALPCPNGGTCTPTSSPFPGYYRCY